MRKYFIDNIRIICILLLFPFHTAMIFNNFGEPFYIHGASLKGAGWFIILVNPWWMTLLFTLAGISSAYALKRRSIKEYAKERISKLLIPFLVGLITIIPLQTYIADVFHNNYTGGYFEHYKIFFTRVTDFRGYDGGLTPGHTWFMLYLFIVSMIMLPIMNKYNKKNSKIDGNQIKLVYLIALFLVILISTPLLEIGGKSVTEALACFAIGFFLLSLDEVQDLLEKNSKILSILFIGVLSIHSFLIYSGQQYGLFWEVEYRLFFWITILTILALGKKYLNKGNSLTRYLSKAAFPLYYFHQSILVIIGFVVLKSTDIVAVQFTTIMVVSFIFSLLSYEVFKRFKLTCNLFGIKQE